MKKRVSFVIIASVLFLILLSTLLVSASTEKMDNAFDCLQNKVPISCDLDSTQETAFSLMALAYNVTYKDACHESLLDLKKESGCWGVDGFSECDLKNTAIAVLALQTIGVKKTSSEISDSLEWMTKQKGSSPSDLNWYLQIDDTDLEEGEQLICDIASINPNDLEDNNKANPAKVIFNSDKSIYSFTDSSSIDCFSNDGSNSFLDNYFLSIQPSCQQKIFYIKCGDNPFTTSFFYTQDSNSEFYLIGNSKSSASGALEVTLPYICLADSIGGECNYEGTLWSALSFQFNERSTNSETVKLLPYLKSEKESNLRLLPPAFLMVANPSSKEAFFNELKNKKSSNNDFLTYWNSDSGYGEYYDTAVSLLGLRLTSYSNSDLMNTTKEWLFSNQRTDGCFSGSTSTDALLIYSAFGKSPATGSSIGWTCTETDSGKDYTNYSSSTSYYWSGTESRDQTIKSDTCQNITNLIEYFCNSTGGISNETVFCEYGCDKGRCRTAEDDLCTNKCNITSETTKCFGSSLYYCVDENNDGCYEWGNSTRCANSCSNGKCTNVSIIPTTLSCTDKGFYCVDSGECVLTSDILSDDYQCPRWYNGQVCCKTPAPTEKTCAERDGKQCASGETCSGSIISSSDTNRCCVGTCVVQEITQTECEQNGYTCRSSCGSNEQTEIYDCDFSDSCCSPKEKSFSWVLIVLLILLIGLIVLAIIYRDQLKVWLFKRKSGFGSTPSSNTMRRPPMPPPSGQFRRPMPRQILPRGQSVPQRPTPARSGDKDFDETMNRLRNMTK